MYFVMDANVRHTSAEARFLWQRLWQLRDIAPVVAMRPAVATSACPLLADEAATSLDTSLQCAVPFASAWVGEVVDLVKYTRGNGELRLAALEAALRSCVERGDQSHDTGEWSTAEMAVDSRMNRRLSIFVRGWGCLVRMRGADPCALSTLRDIEQLADFVVEMLRSVSHQLARDRGHCPSLDASGARVSEIGAEMGARWRRALDDNALRHRNLVTMSPWDLFPRDGPADLRFADLVPLIDRANTVSFLREVDITHWNPSDFRGFHERVAACLGRRSDARAIAKPV